MKNDPEIYKKGKQFSSTNQPAKRGRYPNKLKRFIKENLVSAEDLNAIIKNILFSKKEDQLKEIISDKKQSMIVRFFVRIFLEDFKKGKFDNVSKLIDRVYGLPTQKAELKDVKILVEYVNKRDGKKIDE